MESEAGTISGICADGWWFGGVCGRLLLTFSMSFTRTNVVNGELYLLTVDSTRPFLPSSTSNQDTRSQRFTLELQT